MFGWFKKRDRFDVYRPVDRIIFEFFDGEKQVKADPMVLYKRIAEKKPDIIIDSKVANSESKDAIVAHNKLMDTYRWVFGVKKLEDGGLSEPELANLFDCFMNYCEIVKKNSKPSVTSLNNSGDFKPSSRESQPILNSSASGSTADASSIAEPEPSPLA